MSMENPFGSSEIPPEDTSKPEGKQLPESRPEREPVSYEQALEAAKSLKARGVKNPLDLEPEDPATQEVLDAIEAWEIAAGLGPRGVGTAEKAENIVRAAMIWLDAGYAEPEIVRAAVERLADEHADAVREGSEEPAEILAAAIEDIEKRFAPPNEKEQKMGELQEKLKEARVAIFEARTRLNEEELAISSPTLAERHRKEAELAFARAMGICDGTLRNPFFGRNKKLTQELRRQLEEERVVAQKGYDGQKAKRSAYSKAQHIEIKTEKPVGGEAAAEAEILGLIEWAAALRDQGAYKEACDQLVEAQTLAKKMRTESMWALFERAGDMINAINKL